MIWEISVTVKHLIKKASPALLSFTTSTARFWKAEQKMYASFRSVRVLGYMTVSEMLGSNAGEDLFDIFPEFSKVVHILVVISATSRCSAERSLVSCSNDDGDGGDEVL